MDFDHASYTFVYEFCDGRNYGVFGPPAGSCCVALLNLCRRQVHWAFAKPPPEAAASRFLTCAVDRCTVLHQIVLSTSIKFYLLLVLNSIQY
jgi:hypothetical protein